MEDSSDKSIIDGFHEVLQTNDKTKINFYLARCIVNNASVDDIRYMIDNGADPNYNDDYVIRCAICRGNKDVVLYLINNCAITTSFFNLINTAMTLDQVDIASILFELGFNISDEIIERMLHKHNKFVELLIKHGVSIERIANIFWKTYDKDYDFIIEKIGLFEKYELDLNQSIRNYCKNKTT